MIRFTDLHVHLLCQGLLVPGERLLSRTVVDHKRWWTFKIPQLQPKYLVLATTHRLLMVEHRVGFFPIATRIENVHVIPWQNVETLKMTGFLANKKLKIHAQSEASMLGGQPTAPGKQIRASFAIASNFLGPMPRNREGAKGIVEARQHAQRLSAPPGLAGALPAYANA